MILTEKLSTLFQQTFGPGRTKPSLRPSIYHWPEALAQASDMTVQCPSCSMSYYSDFIHPQTNDHNCPYCTTQRPQIIVLESFRWNGSQTALSEPCWRYTREFTQNSKIAIPRRIFDDFMMVSSDTTDVVLSITKKHILIKKTEDCTFDLSVAIDNLEHNQFKHLFKQLSLKRSQTDMRFWLFSHSTSSRLVLCSIKSGDE